MTVINVHSAPESAAASGRFFDGTSAAPRNVMARLSGDDLVFGDSRGEIARWPLAEVRAKRDVSRGRMNLHPHLAGPTLTRSQRKADARQRSYIFSRAGDELQRFVTDDQSLQNWLLPKLPNLWKGEQRISVKRLLSWASAAVASVAVIVFVLVPLLADQLADFLPPEGEAALGEATLEQIRTVLSDQQYLPVLSCSTDEGDAALFKLTELVSKDVEIAYELKVSVLYHDLVNAFALPGGYVILFDGLLRDAESPDEIAAVLAHEIGHVVNRDPTRGALRSAGSIGVLGLLLGDFAGGSVVLFLVEQLIDASYSRDAEMAADEFAHRQMLAAGINPAAMGNFFQRLHEKYGDADGIVAHFQSHPDLEERMNAARDAGDSASAYRAALSDNEWQALRSICE